MAQKPVTATEKPHSHPNYKTAKVIDEVASVDTAFVPPAVRMAITATTTGTITLRYTPRDQPCVTGKTSR